MGSAEAAGASSSSPAAAAAGADETIGGIGPIVWVRRRNGSWWPGKIMEPEELAEFNVTSPRTGTPVKLLGREDASVDWYNLEKSKRVKAFRCGEFDECIEKAESIQGMRIKKREKYARREDAILHALEIEKELRKQGKVSDGYDLPRNKSPGPQKDSVSGPESLTNNSGKPGNAKSNQLSERINTIVEDEVVRTSVQSQKTNNGTQSKLEDHPEAMPRMRGLQDFGLRTNPLKRKLSSPVNSDDSTKPMDAPPSISLTMERTSHTNGLEPMGTNCRAKRSRCLYLPAESGDSLDDKEHYLDEIDMSPLQFEDNYFRADPVSLSGDNSSSGCVEDDEADSSESNSSDTEFDSSETELDVDEEMNVFPEAGKDSQRQTLALEVDGSISREESDESPLSGDMSNLYPDDPFFTSEAVSKWQLKGKRNIRHLMKSSAYSPDVKVSNGHSPRIYHYTKGSTVARRACRVYDSDLERSYLENGGYSYPSRFASRTQINASCNLSDWEELSWRDQSAFRRQWLERGDSFNPVFIGRHHFGGRGRSVLVDVDLKVQASYPKEPVPIVSLTSKLNGNAIIGHPIQIEAVDDGSSEILVSGAGSYKTEVAGHDGNIALPPWRTARRTNSRVPRPHLSSILGRVNAGLGDPSSDHERRVPSMKPCMEDSGVKANQAKRSLSHPRQPLDDRKPSRKPPKKVSSSSNQKTRTLSSLSIQQSFRAKTLHNAGSGLVDGLIKPETSGLTTVTCIPVKLVFSRLLEKINRLPSKSASKVVVLNRDAER